MFPFYISRLISSSSSSAVPRGLYFWLLPTDASLAVSRVGTRCFAKEVSRNFAFKILSWKFGFISYEKYLRAIISFTQQNFAKFLEILLNYFGKSFMKLRQSVKRIM